MVDQMFSRHQTVVKTAAMRLGAVLAVPGAVLMASGAVLAIGGCNTAKLAAKPDHPLRTVRENWENRETDQSAMDVGSKN